MKLIEALKRIKANEAKISDLIEKIGKHSALKEIETPPYPRQHQQVSSWLQSVRDVSLENEALLSKVHRTNLETIVAININGMVIEKSISAWLYRRTKGLASETAAYRNLTDRGIREDAVRNEKGEITIIKIIRFFDPAHKDQKLMQLPEEQLAIDAALEITNATVDLIE